MHSSTRANRPAAARSRSTHTPSRAPVARVDRATIGWATAAIALAVGLGVVLVRVFLHSRTGAAWDTHLMRILGGPPEAFARIMRFVRTVSPTTVAVTLALSMGLALARRRVAIAAATGTLVVGATVTTQVLKYRVLDRVDGVANALPSGHSTAALLWALGAVLVAPRGWRPAVSLAGTVLACTIGVGTIAGRWHRPSDVVAAAAVCLGWAAGAILLAAVVQRRPRPTARRGAGAGTYVRTTVLGTALSCAVFLGLGFTVAGHGVTKLGAVLVLVAVAGACAATINWVAWFADRELG